MNVRRIDAQGRIVVPKDIVNELLLFDGTELSVEMRGDEIVLRRMDADHVYVKALARALIGEIERRVKDEREAEGLRECVEAVARALEE